MRALLLFVPALTIAAPAPSAAPAPATRNFGVSGFDRIRVDGPFKVTVRTGVAPFARATGDRAGLDTVAVEMQGQTLVVRHNRSAWGGYPGTLRGPVEVTIGTHDLSSAWLNGAGNLAIDRVRGLNFDLNAQGAGRASIAAVQVDRLRVNLLGAATAKVAGSAIALNAVVRGAGGLDASGLKVKDAAIGAEGTVSVEAQVSGTAKVQVAGPASVLLAGRPSCEVKSSGSASVTGCR